MNLQRAIPQTGKFWFIPEVEKQIRTNDSLLLKIAQSNKDVRIDSVQRWFKDKAPILISMDNLELIRAELGFLEIQELIEKIQ